MVKIQIEEFEKRFYLSCKDHCEHDVCVAVSALVNAVTVFYDAFPPKKTAEKSIEYTAGNVEIEVKFKTGECKREFMAGIKSTLMGLGAYAQNYPDEVSLRMCDDRKLKMI